MLKKIAFFVYLLILFFTLFAQENSIQKNETEYEEKTIEKIEEGEADLSEVDEKKDIIMYGLESDIINLIKELKEKNDDRFNLELTTTFSKSKSFILRSAILDFFATIKCQNLNDEVFHILEEREVHNRQEVNAVLFYVGENDLKNLIPILRSIIENEEIDFIESAIVALGKIGGDEEALALVSYYEKVEFEDEKKEIIIKEAIMHALEKLSTNEVLDFLIDIIENEVDNVVVRSIAINALSNIKNDESFNKLLELYSSSEPILRISCIKAISKFDNDEAKNILIEACKDSYYKVRLEAVNSINISSDEVCDLLLYRAKKDPEITVKNVCIEKLSSFNNAKANEWLLKTFADEKTPTNIRVKIAESLLKNNLELIIEELKKVAIETTTSDKYKTLRYDLGRIIAKIKTEATLSIAEAYITNKDVLTKTLGLDMFATNKYSSLFSIVEEISNDKKMGALQKRAKSLLENK